MRRVAIAMVVFACCGMAGAQRPTATKVDDRIDALARKLLSVPVAGISVAVARDGEVVFAHGYGMANLEHSVAVTPETVLLGIKRNR